MTRWRHLDRRRPEPEVEDASHRRGGAAPGFEHARTLPEAPASAGAAEGPAEREGIAEPAALRAARGLYHLREYAACAAQAEAALRAEPNLPAAWRLLGCARGHLDELPAAIEALARAAAAEPHDPRLAASLLSARLRAGETPEPPPAAEGPLLELAGAALWRAGQQSLAAGRPAEAARRFARAGDAFLRAAGPPEEGAPALRAAERTRILAERLAPCCLGEAVSRLLAGELHAAQTVFARRLAAGGPAVLSGSGLDLARRVYELAEAAGGLSPAEQQEAFGPLAALVVGMRLRVAFYDGSGPVLLAWE